MPTITIAKKEYQELVEKKIRYNHLRAIITEEIFSPPNIRSRKEIMKALKSVKKYPHGFLKSIARGLKRSSYFHARAARTFGISAAARGSRARATSRH